MENNVLILLQLFLAHVLVDFVFQSKALVRHKKTYKTRSWFLYVHVFLAGLFTYLILRDWSEWLAPLIIIITHYFIDLWKLYQPKDSLKIFLIDQALHVLVLILVWLYLIEGFNGVLPNLALLFSSTAFIAILTGYLLVIFPVGFIIGRATERWQEEINEEESSNSLKKAGRYIGIFERVLVLTLILVNQFAAIGFLIGAKSILRFTDTKDGGRKQTEYVLIGTLMSFALSILVGLAVKLVLSSGF